MFSSDHQLRQLIFRSASDFSYGVNTLAIGTLKYKVRVLCYTLMNNHLHLLVMGRYEECLAYFRWVLLRLAQMLKARYGINGVLKADAADVQYVTDRQMLLNEVAYLLRNSFKAQIDSPFSYPWAPFEVYFNPGRTFSQYRRRQKDFGDPCPHTGGLGTQKWNDSEQMLC